MAPGNIKRFELKMGKTGLLVTVCGMAVLLCIFFLLGVRVGTHIDSDPEKIASMPYRFLSVFSKPSGPQTLPDIGYEFEERFMTHQDLDTPAIAQTPESEAMTAAVPEAALAELPGLQAMDQRPVETSPKPEAPAPKVTVPLQPAPKPVEEVKKPAIPAPAAVNESRYIVHVASFKERDRAFGMHKSLSGMGFASRVIPVDLKAKGIWYRVVVPDFQSEAQAKKAADQISKKLNVKCIVRKADG